MAEKIGNLLDGTSIVEGLDVATKFQGPDKKPMELKVNVMPNSTLKQLTVKEIQQFKDAGKGDFKYAISNPIATGDLQGGLVNNGPVKGELTITVKSFDENAEPEQYSISKGVEITNVHKTGNGCSFEFVAKPYSVVSVGPKGGHKVAAGVLEQYDFESLEGSTQNMF